MFLPLLKSPSFRFGQKKLLLWTIKQPGLFIHLEKSGASEECVLLFVGPDTTFSKLANAVSIKQNDISLPPGLNLQSKIMSFLLDPYRPKEVAITFGSQTFFLANRASQSDSLELNQCLQDPKSLYGQLNAFNSKQKSTTEVQNANYIHRCYLRLQIKAYLLDNNISLSSPLTGHFKQQLYNYLLKKNTTNYSFDLAKLRLEKKRMKSLISQTQQEIKKIQKFCDTRMWFYKAGAVLVTSVHLVSFAYMIFFVDWLGWDIIEPLTYTVGVIYSLLGIRFYRKYSADRNSETIREAMFQLLMSPRSRMQLKQHQMMLQTQFDHLRKVNQRMRILNNRVAFETSLANCKESLGQE